jgi:GrpB-like predicted nucleotidyltransferase (UPF0157 family)
MIGVARGTVKLSPHNPNWIELFEQEKELLAKFGQVEHIGSTAIPDLHAKPIIDIVIGISADDIKDINKYKKPFTKIGYDYMREDRPNEHLFTKGPEGNRTHYLHMIELNSLAWHEYIKFRDYLINNPEARKRYTDLKIKLATKFANDRKSYTAGKDKLIKEFIKNA